MTTSASSLLRIDFEAAIDKLAGSQLQGTWQLPAELARLAIASGARAAAFDLEPRHLTMTAPGARWDQRTLADFASVLDHRLEAADRHRAMVDLEERGAFALSAVASSALSSLVLRIGGETGLKLELTTAGGLAVDNASESALAQPDVQLSVDGLALDVGRAATWLRRVGRFSPVPITVDGAPIPRGFKRPLLENRLEVRASGPAKASLSATPQPATPQLATLQPAASLPTALAIPRGGSAPRLWLLRHGIIATHATVPGYPAFEAAIEMAALGDRSRGDAPRDTDAVLREQLGPYLEALIDAAVCLAIELGERATGLPEDARARVARLLLRWALKRRRLSEVSGVAMFPLLDTEGRRLVSTDVVGRLVRVEEGGACALDAIEPEDDARRFALAGRGALAISQGERALLGELLGVVFSRPPAKVRRAPGRRLLERITESLGVLRPAGAPVAGSELSDAERALLAQLSAVAVGGAAFEAEFRTGRGKVRRDGDSKLLLPRGNAVVRACAQAAHRDPAWLYPAAVALLGGRELPAQEVRRQWYARFDRA